MTAVLSPSSTSQLLEDLVKKAKLKGANAADAMKLDQAASSVGVRLAEIETLERAESTSIDLRVFFGKRLAVASSSDWRPAALEELVDRAVAMAKLAPEDEFCGIASESDIAKSWPTIEMADETVLSTEQLIAMTREAEEAARTVQGVTNSEGSEAAAASSCLTLVASNGFSGQRSRTNYGISVSVLAGDGTGMERDYDHASRVFAKDLPSPSSIGKNAGSRAVKKLKPRKMPTQQVPIVFDPRVSLTLLEHLASAISGAAIARGTSFLKDKLGQKIFADGITVTDDPFRPRGLRSSPFDAEGIASIKRKIIDAGTLTTWLLDLRSSRQLGLKTTGHASRSAGGQPSPSPRNFYLEPSQETPQEMMRDIKSGFYVTELMGSGINGVTGDYSRAAAGFWIENGVITFPVSEMTVAANLKDMYLNMRAANDLQFLHGFDAPSIRIEGMTAAGL